MNDNVAMIMIKAMQTSRHKIKNDVMMLPHVLAHKIMTS